MRSLKANKNGRTSSSRWRGLAGRAASSQGLMFCFPQAGRTNRPPIEAVIGQLSGRNSAKFPASCPILRPNPVLQINIGATNQNAGRYAYTLSGINAADVYAAAA